MRRIFGRGRYANVTATLALVIALGGTSYAAVQITGKNIKNRSIKSIDLASNSVTSSKVKNGSLLRRDFKSGELQTGARGAQGPKGDKGDKGDTGAPGAASGAGGFVTQLGVGQTLRGYVQIVSNSDANGDLAATSVSFPFPLANAPTPHFLESGTTTPGCTGSAANPTADGGHLCVYETAGEADGGKTVNISRFGFGLELLSLNPGPTAGLRFSTSAAWAVTAPA